MTMEGTASNGNLFQKGNRFFMKPLRLQLTRFRVARALLPGKSKNKGHFHTCMRPTG